MPAGARLALSVGRHLGAGFLPSPHWILQTILGVVDTSGPVPEGGDTMWLILHSLSQNPKGALMPGPCSLHPANHQPLTEANSTNWTRANGRVAFAGDSPGAQLSPGPGLRWGRTCSELAACFPTCSLQGMFTLYQEWEDYTLPLRCEGASGVVSKILLKLKL